MAPRRPPEKWGSAAARHLVAAVRKAGGGVVKLDNGQLQCWGPGGIAVIPEPEGKKADLSEDVTIQIVIATGLKLCS